MESNLPLITVLMPVYNGATYLNDAIDSILKQTFSDFEFLIIDDCSTDQSIDLIKAYNDPRIKLIVNKKNMGQSNTLNKGLSLAMGEYIARMDQDDISMPVRLKKQMEFMDECPNIGVCGSWIQHFGKYDYLTPLELDDDSIKIKLLTNQNLAHSSVMIRKSTLVKYQLNYDPTFTVAMDYDLWVRMFEYCSFANLPEPLLKYRTHKNQKSKIISGISYSEMIRVLALLLEKMDFRFNRYDLSMHYKIVTGTSLDSLNKYKVFKYLIRLRSQNRHKEMFDSGAFNKFIRLNWRRFMLENDLKMIYRISLIFFFRTADYSKQIEKYYFILINYLNPKKNKRIKYNRDNYFNNLGIYHSAVSSGMIEFNERFNKKYNLVPLSSTDELTPCVFFGMYFENDVQLLLNHRGDKYVLFGGSDIDTNLDLGKTNLDIIKHNRLQNILVLSKKTKQNLKKYEINSTFFEMSLVNKSIFYPRNQKNKSNKVYIYDGQYRFPRPDTYGAQYFGIIKKRLPQFKYIFSSSINVPYQLMGDLYNKVFIIVRLTLNDGNANTVQEAEAMGIPAVHNISDYGLKWKSIDDVINHIKDAYDKQYLGK
jgi:glycosyltransferase involved in cell wall biosynthesis